MVIQGLTHAVLSTAILFNPFHAVDSGFVQKSIVTQPSALNRVSIEKHWNFAIENYTMHHHQGFQLLNIAVSCTSNQVNSAPRLFSMYGDVSQFLRRYPNEDDYWEIINRELAKTILHNYSELSSVSITLEVLSTDRLPYPRASIVTQSRGGESKEGWRFTARVPVQMQGDNLNYEAEYLYRDGIANTEYPDFIPISNRIEQLLMTAMIEGEPWEDADRAIAENILQKYPALASFTSHVEARAEGK